MLKFFRKYNKLILVVGGSLLMVIFLLPTTITETTRRGAFSRTVAYMDGRKVSALELLQAAKELDVIARAEPWLMIGLGIEAKDDAHWLLLTREAREAGFVGGAGDAREGLSETDLRRLTSRDVSLDDVERALAHSKGIIRLVEASNPASVYSAREAVALGKRLLDSATVGVVQYPALRASLELPEPDEARLEEHFERFRGVDPLTDPHGVGYRRKPAVRLEWMLVDRLAVQAAFTPDPIEVNKHWRQNQSKFPGEFASVRMQVELDFKRVQVDQAMERAVRFMKTELYRATAGLAGDGLFKVLPEDWAERMPSLPRLAEGVNEELRRVVPSLGQAASVPAVGQEWLTDRDLSMIPRAGQSAVRAGPRVISFQEYVLAVRELGLGREDLGAQVGMVYGPLMDATGNHVYFRVTEARPAGPAESLDEVRDLALADLRMLDGLELLREQADVYRERAVADGLSALAESLGVPVQWGITVTRTMARSSGGFIESPFDVPEFRDAVMDLAERLDPTVDPDGIDPALRTAAVVLPTARGLVVAQITRWRPMTLEQFRAAAPQIRQQAGRELAGQSLIDAFSYDRLASRHGFRLVDERESRLRVRGGGDEE